jgi:hypothetical protein
MPSRATFYTRFWSNSEFLQAAFAKGREWEWYFAIGARDSQRYYDFRTSNVFNSVPHVCNPPAPGKSYGLCSRSVVGAPKTVTFNDACGNGTELAVTWVNPSCQGIHTGDIPVGQSLSVATYVGQVLQIRDKVSGAVVSEFVVRDTDDQITVPDSLEGLAHDWPSVASCETTPCPQGMQCTNTTTGPQCSCPSGTVPSQGTCVPEGNPRCNFPQPLTTIGNVSPSYATPEKVFRIANRCGDGDVVGLYWVDSTGQEHRMQELPPGGTNINSYIDHVFRVKNERVKPDPNNPNAALPPTTIGEFIVRDDRDTKYIPDMF